MRRGLPLGLSEIIASIIVATILVSSIAVAIAIQRNAMETAEIISEKTRYSILDIRVSGSQAIISNRGPDAAAITTILYEDSSGGIYEKRLSEPIVVRPGEQVILDNASNIIGAIDSTGRIHLVSGTSQSDPSTISSEVSQTASSIITNTSELSWILYGLGSCLSDPATWNYRVTGASRTILTNSFSTINATLWIAWKGGYLFNIIYNIDYGGTSIHKSHVVSGSFKYTTTIRDGPNSIILEVYGSTNALATGRYALKLNFIFTIATTHENQMLIFVSGATDYARSTSSIISATVSDVKEYVSNQICQFYSDNPVTINVTKSRIGVYTYLVAYSGSTPTNVVLVRHNIIMSYVELRGFIAQLERAI